MSKQKKNIIICLVPSIIVVLGLAITGFLRGPEGIQDGPVLKFLFTFCFITAPVLLLNTFIQIMRLK